jgi:uncharacterized protein
MLENIFDPPHAAFVVKITKFCNLRCTYCYEYPHLSDKSRMSLDDIRSMFLNIAGYYRHFRGKTLKFIWHGGEPLMIEHGYYREIYRLQKEIFGPHDLHFVNNIQTNLSILKLEHLSLFQEKIIEGIGVSLDVFGDLRVNVAGRPVQAAVLNNMQTLLDNRIPFGCITVLSQATLPLVEEIYDFFETLKISSRFLPIYRTGYAGQQDKNSVNSDQILMAFKKLFDRWLSAEYATEVEPIEEFISYALNKYYNNPLHFYDKAASDFLFIVNTNGDTYNTGNVYHEEFIYGNIFSSPLSELLKSEGRKKSIEQAQARVSSICSKCEFYGHCPGFYVAEATEEQMNWSSEAASCSVLQPLLRYMLAKFSEIKLPATIAEATDAYEFVG